MWQESASATCCCELDILSEIITLGIPSRRSAYGKLADGQRGQKENPHDAARHRANINCLERPLASRPTLKAYPRKSAKSTEKLQRFPAKIELMR